LGQIPGLAHGPFWDIDYSRLNSGNLGKLVIAFPAFLEQFRRFSADLLKLGKD
jgi:hypothetical protein